MAKHAQQVEAENVEILDAEQELSSEQVISPEQKKNKRNKIIALILAIIAIIIIILLLVFNCSGWFDKNAQEGYYSGKTEQEIIDDLNRQVKEGEMACSIAHTVKFDNGTDNPGLARIENIAANHVDQKVSIILTSNNAELYSSDAIRPGYYIEYIDSKVHLDPGLYDATAIFTGYNQETHQQTGQLASKIVIDVK